MAGRPMMPVFLSASVPSPGRDPRYDQTADAAAIAEAVRALALFVLRRTRLIFGGHPAISPLVRTAAEAIGAVERVTIYQSRHFERFIPRDSLAFSNIVWTEAVVDGDEKKNVATSLRLMRETMLRSASFSAGVFIGGMEGIEDEYELFRELHPTVPVFPIASTGAAALLLFQEKTPFAGESWPAALLNETSYDALFAELLGPRPSVPVTSANGGTMPTAILSDLHLGNGGLYDMFAGEQQLPELLDSLAGPWRLILNGDTFDFLMNEDPLELTDERACTQARAIVAAPATAGVLAALGRLLARGGEIQIRVGNHDVEVALPSVQAIIRAAICGERAAALEFKLGDEPTLLDVGGAKILVAHGEQDDDMNRIAYGVTANGAAVIEPGRFEYPPGSRLVRTLLNPLIREQHLRYLDFLKPDFEGAALSALGTNPRATRKLLSVATLRILWDLVQNAKVDPAFELAPRLDSSPEQTVLDGLAALSPEEKAELEDLLQPNEVEMMADLGPRQSALRRKLAKIGMRWYAKTQRRFSGEAGDKFFSLVPEAGERANALRLRQKFGVSAVVAGHTHAARWQAEDDLVYANTGTWIWLMRLPAPTADDAEWDAFLAELQQNPGLDPAQQQLARTERHFHWVSAEPADDGALLTLRKLDGGDATILGQTRLPRQDGRT